jgi:transcriptional regulator with XRE-family HTH domain
VLETVRKRFGVAYKAERTRLGITQAQVLDAVSLRTGTFHDENWVSKIETGDIAKLDRTLVAALVEALSTTPLRAATLFVEAGLSPIATHDRDSARALAYLAMLMESHLCEVADFARQAEIAEARGQDHARLDARATATIRTRLGVRRRSSALAPRL